jgi:hypothetical protein
MALSGLKERISGILGNIRGIPEKAGGFFGKSNETSQTDKSFPGKINELFSVLVNRIKNFINNVGPDKRKLMLIGLGALVVLFLILAITVGVSSSKKRRMASPDTVERNLAIPKEELFIPAEPDFVPEFIFEREKRRFWSLEDIRQYWRTPDSGDRWRDEIKSAVDKLMEGIP